MNSNRWLLPEGIEELLPQEAAIMERWRRQLLDMFACWGYELVIPPFVEYIESLLTGVGNDLDLQTFKIIDQKNGRLMGVRADMTPQVARIDAHQLGRPEPTRLCYIGTVLHTQPNDFTNARSLTQIGAELYGFSGIEADAEILKLMLEMLKQINVADVYLDIGHVDVFGSLIENAGLSSLVRADLLDAVNRKSTADIGALLQPLKLSAEIKEMIQALIWLNGGEEVLAQARQVLRAAGSRTLTAIDQVENLATYIKKFYPEIELHFDLAELRGVNYHTGVIFAAYTKGVGQAIAQGGRYDHIGEVFGRARPATGFSADLRTLLQYSAKRDANINNTVSKIFAPAVDDKQLDQRIVELRQQGNIVVQQLPGQMGDAKTMGCDKSLAKNKDSWEIK